MNKSSIILAMLLAFSLTACVDDRDDGVQGIAGTDGIAGTSGTDGVSRFVTRTDVITSNTNIAYADSLISAKNMRDVFATFVTTPSQTNYSNAKQAWLAAREPYEQTEVYRFRKGPIDTILADGTLGEEGDGPEGRINAWPLGEAIINYRV
jgi:putative iron-regulated protein